MEQKGSIKRCCGVKHETYQKERLARAREGKDGRPPRFDPVLDEVAAKLEKEVIA